jgi:hypothetical protein
VVRLADGLGVRVSELAKRAEAFAGAKNSSDYQWPWSVEELIRDRDNKAGDTRDAMADSEDSSSSI